MAITPSLLQRIRDFRPSKTAWFWSCAACVGLTVLVGFTSGMWETTGSAKEQAMAAANDARAELIAENCVARFTAGDDATARLQKLHAADSWNRSSILEKGGWVKPAGIKKSNSDAAFLCADRLEKIKSLPQHASTAVPPSTSNHG